MSKEEKLKELKERVIRWDAYRINQFSYINNLLLVLNLAFLGFFVTQTDLKFSHSCFFVAFQTFSLLLLVASFITGMLLVFNRLQDFRLTARLVKKRRKKFKIKNDIPSESKLDIDKISFLKYKTRAIGKITWCLLKWQIGTFSVGIIIGVLFLLLAANISGA